MTRVAPSSEPRGRLLAAVLFGVALLVLLAGLTAVRVRTADPSGVAFDRDGDGRADPITWQPASGRWQIGADRLSLGRSGDVPVPADWDGDGLVDPGVWRPETGLWEMPGRAPQTVGLAGDLPVPCGWHRSDRVDPAIWRPGNGGWYDEGGALGFLGVAGDAPVPADWHGDATCDLAVFRAADGSWPGTGRTRPFGLPGDVPVPGDWDGDGTVERAIWCPSSGTWIVDGPEGPMSIANLGLSGDEPAPGDWDGDGALEPGIWRTSEASWRRMGGEVLHAGVPGDEPLVLAPAIRVLRHPPALRPPTDAQAATSTAAVGADLFDPGLRPWLLVTVALTALSAGWVLRSRGPDWVVAAGRWVVAGPPSRCLLLASAATLPLTGWRLGPAAVGDALLVTTLMTVLVERGPRELWRSAGALPASVRVGGAAALAGGLVGTAGAIGASALARAAAGVGLPLLVVATARPTERERRLLALAFAGGAAVSVLVGLGGLAAGERLAGLATHPNHLGLTCVLGAALAAGAAAAGASARLAGLILVVDVLGVVLSGSRSALLGLLIVILAMVVGSHGTQAALRRVRFALATAAVTAVSVALVHGAFLGRMAGDRASDAGHRFRMELALERIQRAPLTGEGFRFLEEAHSIPVQLLVAGGPLTLFGGGLLLAAPLVVSHRRRREPLTHWLMVGWAAYLAGGIVQNITVDRYVWFTAALLLNATSSRPRAPSPRRPLRQGGRVTEPRRRTPPTTPRPPTTLRRLARR